MQKTTHLLIEDTRDPPRRLPRPLRPLALILHLRHPPKLLLNPLDPLPNPLMQLQQLFRIADDGVHFLHREDREEREGLEIDLRVGARGKFVSVWLRKWIPSGAKHSEAG